MELTVISPRGILFTKKVAKAAFPGVKGEFTVLPRHASLVSELKSGVISYEVDGAEQQVAITGGYVEVDHARAEAYVELAE